jgi:hypothetical protein
MYNSYRYAWVASTPELPSTGTTVDLGVGQIGVFDGKTYQAKSLFYKTMNMGLYS